MNLKKIILLCIVLFSTLIVRGQSLTYSFTDPCTQEVTNFSFPLQQGQSTIIFFLGKQRTFTASDVASGAFGTWINQVYTEYRRVMPCSVQSTNVIRNQIITQVIGNTVQSVVGNIIASARSEASGNDASSKGKSKSNKKQKKNGNNNNNNNGSVSNGSSIGDSKSNDGTQTTNQNPIEGSSQNTQNSNGSDGNNSGSIGGTSTGNGSGNNETTENGQEVIGAVTMNVDARNDKGGGNGKSSQRSNPIIVSSDYTNAQNLDRSFTGIINIGMSQSSLTGTSSWGVTSMVWFNFRQFALSGRYTKIHFSGNGKLKFIHNFNLTGLYTYDNYMGFVGYSGILNAGKWGVTGLNISAAATKITNEGNTFLSPSITFFYTKPFTVGQRLTLSPEVYVISTPLVYSSLEKVTVTDRTFSGFIGTGLDYQITKRFKVNMNYKLNVSTSPDFPILSFFLIGSKVNL